MKLTEQGKCKITLPGDLQEAVFVSRLNRFVAEIDLGGRRELAHVPSSGRMAELLYPGARIFVSTPAHPGAKLKYRILLADRGGNLVSVDSLLPNRLVYRALQRGSLPELSSYGVIRRESAFGHGRFDFFLGGDQGNGCYVEVKSVTLVEDGVALFPDAPSERGARHMAELTAARREGYRAVVLLVIQRDDAHCFKPNWGRDPQFSRELSRAAAAGVEVLARRCRVSSREVVMDGKVPVEL
ncbi:MAG: DNA/RNA nuclease SfsA [Bacillota bacterium]